MKKIVLAFVFGLSLSAIHGPGYAMTTLDVMVFPVQTLARDENSGNGWDFKYSLKVSPPNLALLSATLRLTHSGNADEGPSKEIWIALTSEGNLIGRLGESESKARTDEWVLPPSVLSELIQNDGRIDVILSEQTAYNSEQIALIRSELEVESRSARAPAVPEPAGGFILGAGILAGIVYSGSSKLRRIIYRRKD